MDDVNRMEILKTQENTANKESGFILGELFPTAYMIS